MTTKVLITLVVFFYAICWITDQPTKTIWWLGVVLPWLSVFASIPVTIIGHIEEKDNWRIWCYVYAVATLLYIIVVLPMSGSILNLIPHLGCCIFAIWALIAYNKRKGCTHKG